MDKKKLAIYGGVGAVALIGGFFLLNRGGGEAAANDGGYFPPTIYSSGGGGIASGDSGSSSATGTAASTDTSIAALIASQLSTAQMNADTTKYTANIDKDIALAGYANSLAITKEQSNASIMQGLASSLGQIVKTFQGSGSSTTSSGSSSSGFLGLFGGGSSQSTSSSSYTNAVHGVGGSIGYKDGVISLDVKQLYDPNLQAINDNLLKASQAAIPGAAGGGTSRAY